MNEYKYKPEDFQDKAGLNDLADDLAEFYRLLEVYRKDKSGVVKAALHNQAENLFFEIKHRALDGALTETTKGDLYEYLGELLYD